MDKNNFCHFVCSRFNIYLKENIIKYKWDISEEEWMEKHLDSFEMGLIPSIKNQTCQNFNYICWFDERTSQKHRDRINNIKKNFSNFSPLFIDLPEDPEFNIKSIYLKNAQKKYIKEFCGENKKIILQTRIDIDDYIHKKFIEILQDSIDDCFKKQFKDNLLKHTKGEGMPKVMSVYFPYGYHVSLFNKSVEFFKLKGIYNQFCTIIENNNENLTGLWDIEHALWEYVSNKIILDMKEPMWLWTIHNNNLGHRGWTSKWKPDKRHVQCKYDKKLFYDNFSFKEEYSKRLVN